MVAIRKIPHIHKLCCIKTDINEYKIQNFINSIFLFSLLIVSHGQKRWTEKQKEIIQTMNGLSESTALNGKGVEAYSKFLSEDFSRWTIGSEITNDKEKWVEVLEVGLTMDGEFLIENRKILKTGIPKQEVYEKLEEEIQNRPVAAYVLRRLSLCILPIWLMSRLTPASGEKRE